MTSGKYRLRTAIREHAPELLADRIPKGKNDCGNHEWYKQAESTWRCYHCVPGQTHEVPWDDRELNARRWEAGASLIRAGFTPAPPDAAGVGHRPGAKKHRPH